MRALARFVTIVVLLISSSAFAQFCSAAVPDCKDATCKCGAGLYGDPIDLGSGSSVYRMEDAALPTTLGPISFRRSYTSSELTWYFWPLEGPAMPFGPAAGPPDAGAPPSMKWWHSFFAFARKAPMMPGYPISSYFVRGVDGHALEFSEDTSCTTLPCFGINDSVSSPAKRGERLQRTATGFILYTEDGQQQFEGAWGQGSAVTHYFLTKVIDLNGATVATVEYATPVISGVTCPTGQSGFTTAGVPYVRRVVSADGSSLEFSYRALATAAGSTACVLSSVGYLDRSTSTVTPAVSYAYRHDLPDAGEGAGLVARATFNNHQIDYTYVTSGSGPPTQLVVSGAANFSHSYSEADAGHYVVTAAVTPTESLAVTYASSYEDAGVCGGFWPIMSYPRYVTDAFSGKGDGTDAGSGWTRKLLIEVASPERDLGYEDSCSTPACSVGSVQNEWSCAPLGLERLLATKDKRGNWEVYEYDAGAEGPADQLELLKVVRGASSSAGAGGLEQTRFAYTYVNAQQLLSKVERDSVLGPSATTERRIIYDGQRVAAEIERGYTQELDGGPTQKYRGIFYYKRHECLSGTNDALSRTVEVHGPCWADGFSATDCSNPSTEPAPITQYFYNEAAITDGGGNRGGRLARVRTLVGALPSNCSGASALDSDYEDYNAQGSPTAVRDSNGVLTTMSWEDDRLASMTTGDAGTYTFTWEGKQLTAVQAPQGNFDVYCYRQGTSGAACSGGTVTDRVQWQAKAATATGTPYSEKKTYSYWPDGTVSRVSYLDSSGTVRRVEQYAADAHRRPTWAALGDVSGTPVSVRARAFDAADNVEAVGHPYNAPPAWCRETNGTISSLCQKLTHDAADRLVSAADPGTDQSTLFAYDAHGNIAGVKAGCSASSSYSSCSSPATSYVHDDFGNLVQTRTPWSFDGYFWNGIRGTTQYLRNALGEVTAKRIPSMYSSPSESLRYAYDTLGRPLSVTHEYGTNQSEVLYALAYDAAGSNPPANCPQPANTLGRLRKKTDSFGDTWYQYNVRGQLLMEIRLRPGVTSCSGAAANLVPHTTYGYSANGNLTSMTLPYGRPVTFSIGTYSSPYGALPTDRVSSISLNRWNGTAFVADSAWTDMVTDIAWEPYGGLRGYRINHPTTGTSSAVEYRLGDSESVPGGAGCAAPGANDLSGQLRSLYVSQVSTGAWSPGTGSGDVFKRTLTWSGELPVQADSCLLGATTAQREQYSFDSALRLTSAQRPGGNRVATGGSYSERTWVYDKRGNVQTSTTDGLQWSHGYMTPADWGVDAPDLLKSVKLDAGTGGGSSTPFDYSYGHDSDGRVITRLERGGTLTLEPGVAGTIGGAQNSGALDSVLKTVTTTSSVTYSYFYDANNRRRLKVYPTSVEDEYFYSADSSHLVVDVGNDSVTTPTFHPLDEYIWLGGRPLVVIRGRVGLDYARAADGTTSCGRNGGSERCDTYFPVTDEQGRVVLMLDGSRRVAGVGEYDVHGAVNRSQVAAQTPHPYDAGLDVTMLSMQQPRPGLNLEVRAHFAYLDTEDQSVLDGGATDFAELQDSTTSTQLAGPYFGHFLGPFWTGWVAPSGDTVNLRFKSDTQKCCWGSCESPWCSAEGPSVDRWEYRKYQSTATWFWVPLRLAGQYEDAETELHENWNRFYEPPSGRYLSPEPLLQSPRYVKKMAKRGMSVPTYAYAANNPLRYGDSTGLETEVLMNAPNGWGPSSMGHVAVNVNGRVYSFARSPTGGSDMEITTMSNYWVNNDTSDIMGVQLLLSAEQEAGLETTLQWIGTNKRWGPVANNCVRAAGSALAANGVWVPGTIFPSEFIRSLLTHPSAVGTSFYPSRDNETRGAGPLQSKANPVWGQGMWDSVTIGWAR